MASTVYLMKDKYVLFVSSSILTGGSKCRYYTTNYWNGCMQTGRNFSPSKPHSNYMTISWRWLFTILTWRTFQRTVGGEQRRYRNLKFKWVIFYYYTSWKSSAEKLMWIFMNECCISSIQIASSVRNFCRLTHTENLKVINYLLKIMMNELFKTAEQTE